MEQDCFVAAPFALTARASHRSERSRPLASISSKIPPASLKATYAEALRVALSD